MLSVLGESGKLCDGVTRREAMRVGSLSLFAGMTVPRLLQAASASPSGFKSNMSC